GDGQGGNGAAEEEGQVDRALVCGGIGADPGGRHAVDHQRRGGVEVAHHDAVLVGERGPEENAGHLDTVGSAVRGGDRAEETTVGIADVGIDHVQVALVHRDVGRFAHRAAGVVQPGRGLRQLDEVAEVLD